MIDGESEQLSGSRLSRCGPMYVIELCILAEILVTAAPIQVLLQLRARGVLGRAKQPRHRKCATGVGVADTVADGLGPQKATKEAREKSIPGSKNVVHRNIHSRPRDCLIETLGDGIGEYHTTQRSALAN